MGEYLNPTNDLFARALRSKIYVDKTGMIARLNELLLTEDEFVCISRPRRFGKTMAASMLAAYYSRGCDSKGMFSKLKIASDPSFEEHLNKYNVIYLNMTAFTSPGGAAGMIGKIEKRLLSELQGAYPSVNYLDKEDLALSLQNIYSESRVPFVFIIDEWDCALRENKSDKLAYEAYLNFLRVLLKDKAYVALAYMTGILPIKKYGTHSTLNMFDEYSMTRPLQFAEYTGFTGGEVKALCERHGMDFEEMAQWYNGYRLPGTEAIYSPQSVVSALMGGFCDNYWITTEAYTALSVYIAMNFDGLKDAVVRLMAGGRQAVSTRRFSSSMGDFTSYHDILTLLVHLGYLGYDFESKEAFVPNKEIYGEFADAVADTGWDEVIRAVENANKLMEATWRGDAEAVAEMLEKAHLETSILTYNDENALSYTVSLAYYNAREYYTTVREMPAGKGFADLAFLPVARHMEKPAMIVELKWDKTAEGAISQIESRGYLGALEGYSGRVLLVGVNYNKQDKKHECIIKEIVLNAG